VASLAQAGDGFEPIEDLLDAFAFLLANHTTAMMSRALIDNAGL
jgi:hypothetical protein